MTRNHVIISGTGRAGTTFLVQILTQLGASTGFQSINEQIYENCHAGMEQDLRNPNCPYVVKSPYICDYLEDFLAENDVVIDHAFIPVRDLYSAAESRRLVQAKSGTFSQKPVPGGLFHTLNPQNQETVLTLKLYKLINAITLHDIPLTLLHFPRIIQDPEYLYQKIHWLMPKKIGWYLPGFKYSFFLKAFHQVSRAELVHDFARPVINQSLSA